MSKRLPAFFPFWASAVLTAVLLLWPAPIALATSKFWKNSAGSGTWSNGNNWSNVSAAGAGNDGAPGMNDSVIIAPTSGTAPTVDYNATTILTELFVDFTGAGTSTLSMPNGNGLTAQRLYVGGWNGAGVTSGRGAINQMTGSVVVSGVGALDFLDVGVGTSSTGTYNLGGGTLQANTNEYIGDLGTGIFNHIGGTNTISGAGHSLYIGGGPTNGTGTYTISGSGSTSTLSVANDVVVGNTSTGTGTLTVQNLGSVQIANNLTINGHGTVNLNGGTLRFNSFSNLGTFNYTSGTIQLAGNRNLGFAPITTIFGATPTVTAGKALVIEGAASLTSTFNVNGGALAADNGFSIGDQFSPTGTLNVTGGATVNSSGGVTMAGLSDSSAAATISGPGSIWTTAGFTLAGDGTATLNVNNGGKLLNIGNALMSLGFDASSTATVTGANSLWNVTGNFTVGNLDAGTLNVQDQGLVFVGSQLSIGADGVINLDGGTIRFNDYFRFDNGAGTTGTFNFNTGTIQLAGNRSIGTDLAIKDLFGASPRSPPAKV